jgi:hypothetical protein
MRPKHASELIAETRAPGALAGTHADLVDPEDMLELLQMAPPALFDCVLDAKQKDRRS